MNCTLRFGSKLGFLSGVLMAAASLASCAGSATPSILRGAMEPEADPGKQYIWVGKGTAWRYQGSDWVRVPSHDYQFLVRQNRFEDRWESLKIQNRTNEKYDGSAGPADQQHFFRIQYGTPAQDGTRPILLSSTYGDGTGRSDAAYRLQELEFDARGISSFAPYNRFRLRQEYRYEEGLLLETIELFKRGRDGKETPFMRFEERARMVIVH